jgi:3-oxoadipate enol-lactonase
MESALDPRTPVVLLHAFPLNPGMWEAQRRALHGRPVVAPAFPGFGGRPPAGDADLDRFVDAVVADMDGAGIARAAVVGLSMGGYVALRMHARHGDRVAALVLADTRAGADDESAGRKRTEQAERVRKEGVGWLADALLPALLGETTRRDRPNVVEQVVRMIGEADPEGVAQALLAMRDRPDSTEALAGIQVPVLALVGGEDTLTPRAEALLIAEKTPGGEMGVIRDAGHLSSLENPAAFNEALEAFLGF